MPTARATRALALAFALALAALVLAGCAGPGLELPDDDLPGVYTDTDVRDEFRCGELLFAQGCVIVRIPHVDSGCSPEVGGYVVCNATLEWTAESGAVVPGSRLSVLAGGAQGPSCDPAPGAPCSVSGTLNHTRHFDAPGQEETWNVTVEATLTAPGDAPATTGGFTLELAMHVRTEEASALTS